MPHHCHILPHSGFQPAAPARKGGGVHKSESTEETLPAE